MRLDRSMTLVEVLAVVVILGLLAGTLLIGFSGTFGRAKHEIAKSGMGVVITKLELYRLTHDSWPSTDVGLAALTDGHAKPNDAYYLNQGRLNDPWGRRFLFVTPGPDGHPYEVISYGADGQPGGDGENADLSSVDLGRGES
ncbi:MAG: type II secretion system major pseudopilin GspG [Acidimicrobiia bacterium]|nr:type II secretion system major pseudopilin GspG [Acidimicrobiia bacterium]